MRNIRINNIQIRKIFDKDSDYQYEIVKWFPNNLYGKEHEYMQCPTDPDFYIKKNSVGWKVHKSCFVNPEFCCVVAFITRSDEPDVVSVGCRPWEFGESDRKDFDSIINKFFNTNNKTT